MTSRLRSASLALAAAAGLLIAPLALASSASAAPVSNVLFFSNDDYTDIEEEDLTQIAALQASGATVTAFDGGDGSAAAWTAAIAGKQAVVIPESSSIFESAALSAEAADVLKAFVAGGGTLLLPTEYQAPLLSYITDVDYASVWSTGGDSEATWPLALDDPAFPAELGYSDGTYPIFTSEWADVHYNASFPVYYNGETEEGAVIGFPVGTGFIYTLAYDWYPGDEETDIANRDLWNIVQGLLLPFVDVAPAPAPQLADTGAPLESSVLVAGAALLLMAQLP